MTVRLILPLVVLLVVAGCSDMPPDWTRNETVSMPNGWNGPYPYSCGNDIEGVESVTGKKVEKLETMRGPYTHAIDEVYAVVWLGFLNGKLRYYQATWRVKGRMAEFEQGRDLCHARYIPDIPVPRRR